METQTKNACTKHSASEESQTRNTCSLLNTQRQRIVRLKMHEVKERTRHAKRHIPKIHVINTVHAKTQTKYKHLLKEKQDLAADTQEVLQCKDVHI